MAGVEPPVHPSQIRSPDASPIPGRPPRNPHHGGRLRHDMSLGILQVESKLDEAAVGPPPERRAVTKTEYAEAKKVIQEAKETYLDGMDYEAARQQYEKELQAAASLTAGAESELAKVREENKKLRTEIEELQKKHNAADQACNRSLTQLAKLKREVDDHKAEKTSLQREIDHLLNEIDILKQNLGIQESNVSTLKALSEKLQEDILRYRKRQDEISERHRLAILRMEMEITKDVEELNEEYSAKEAKLQKMIQESEELRRRAEQEWADREARLERLAKEEVKAKNDELQKLRLKIEQLLREQIDSVRDRVKKQSQPATPAKLVQPHRTAAAPPKDLNIQTAEVLNSISSGKRILSLAIVTKSGDHRPPVQWRKGMPAHLSDLNSLGLAVQLSVDQSALHLIPRASRTSLSSTTQGEEWRFATNFGTELVVGIRFVASSA
eukprot:Sspe_Gene.99694::Locus_73425_Transcript_5_10_Confidence_0.154_Length_1411::g.99694::m.99694